MNPPIFLTPVACFASPISPQHTPKISVALRGFRSAVSASIHYVPQGLRATACVFSRFLCSTHGSSFPCPCVRCSRLCSAGWLRLSCPACVQNRAPRNSRLCRFLLRADANSVGQGKDGFGFRVVSVLDYFESGWLNSLRLDNFKLSQGLRALRALVSTMLFRRVSFVPCVRALRASAGSPCPACVALDYVMFRRMASAFVPCVRFGSDGHEGLRSRPACVLRTASFDA